MSKQKEQTLQIKNFKGIDRFVEGAAQDTEVFEVIQNMFSPNPGELRNLDGVLKLNPAAIPGVQEIVHGRFLDTPEEKGIVLVVKPTTTLPAAPTGWTFSTTGGTPVNHDIYVEYGVPGGGKIATKYTQNVEANGIFPISPGNIPDQVRYISFYIGVAGATDGQIARYGSFFRKQDGTFPTSIQMFPTTSAVTAGLSCEFIPGKFSATAATGGVLQGGRIYYFGLGAWFRSSTIYNNNVAFTTQNANVMSFFLPSGSTQIDFDFNYCPFNALNATSGPPINAEFSMDRVMVYAGTSPTDMLPACPFEGYTRPYSKTTASETLAHSNVSNLYTSTSNNFPVGSLLKMTNNTASGASNGLTNNSYYYVKTSTPTTTGCTFTVAATKGGTVINPTGAGTSTWAWSRIQGSIKEIAHSLPDSVYEAQLSSTTGYVKPTGAVGRYNGLASQTFKVFGANPATSSTAPNTYHGIYFPASGLSNASRRDLFINPSAYCLNLSNYSYYVNQSSIYPSGLPPLTTDLTEWQSRQITGRIWFTNGFNEPMYTNGYMWKMAVPANPTGSDTENRWPITRYIEFYKNMMILADQDSNISYQEGYAYHSNLSSGDITDFNRSGTTLRAIAANTGDQSIIHGLNIYSQDLTSVGAETFLVIGKKNSIFVWDGTSGSAKQISRVTGLAGPNAYALTKFGPVFVGQDNVWLFKTSTDIMAIGDPVKDIIKGLSATELYNIDCIYHDEEFKIGYDDVGTHDKEIWMRLQQVPGGLNRIWTGPHNMESYKGQTQIIEWNGDRNYRLSYNDTELFRRDDPGTVLNNGIEPTRRLRIRNLGLGADHNLKVVNGMSLHLGTIEDEDFDLSLESEDGSQSVVLTFTDTYNSSPRHMKNVQIPQRFLARVLTLTLENTNDSTLSIYDFSILFQALRRKLLP